MTKTFAKKGIKPKDYEEAKKMAREYAEENRLRKERVKGRQGYKYYCHTVKEGCGIPHRVYFRHLQSAEWWVKKHPQSSVIFNIDGIPAWILGKKV